MAIINKGKSFANGEQLTADKLNQVIDNATFTTSAVDNVSTQLSSGAIIVKDGGISTPKLADDSVTAAKLSSDAVTEAITAAYPIGSIYMNATNSANPATLLGFGTWATFGAGKVPVGIDSTDADFDVVGSGTNTNGTTGDKTVSLSEAELPQHHHLAVVNGAVSETGDVTSSNAISESATQGGSTNQSYTMRPATSATFGTVGRTSQVGSGTAHNNLQPYIVVYMWKRTA
jgi:microcystin-dependent protein